MTRKISFKMVLLFAFALFVLFSFTSTKAFAAETKEVTVTVPTTVTCPSTVIGNVLQSISTSTYSYDDGSYKGTLSFVSISNLTATLYATYPDMTMYTYSFIRTYSGTVTAYELPATMEVTAIRAYDITAPLDAVDSIKLAMANSTYAYDDGTYKGTLSYVSITSWTQTVSPQYPNTTLYRFTFNVNYAGTVTKY